MAAVSESSTVALKSADTPVYSLGVAVPAACPMSTLSSAPSRSRCAVSVTVCAAFQFVGVNVSDDAPTRTAPVSGLVTATVTVCRGSVAKRTR